MAADSYSFLDIVALAEVRERFGRGDALVMLSTGLDEVLWANGPGASLFGFGSIDALLDAPAPIGGTARRQIAATRGFPAIGANRSVSVRLQSGTGSRAIPFRATALPLPDGATGILLSLPHGDAAPAAAAGRALSGIAQPGQAAAIVSAEGEIVAASPDFAGFGLASELLRRLVAKAAEAPGQALKQKVLAGERVLPAGVAVLEGGASLVIVTEDDFFELPDDVMSADEAEAADWDAGEPPALSPSGPADEAAAPEEDRQGVEILLDDADDWYFRADDGPGSGAPETPEARLAALRASPPVRFSWRTDPQGRFVSVSPEFTAFANLDAGALDGGSFGAVAAGLGIQGGEEVAQLLNGRDTWSGRTVLWPVFEGAALVPVDLAALPTYSRARSFEGFRGFGVARTADAVPAPSPDAAAGGETQPAEAASAGDAVPDAMAEPVPASASPTLKDDSDRVVQLLAGTRPVPADAALSPDERDAFLAIGARLKGDEGDETFPSAETRNDTGNETRAAPIAEVSSTASDAQPGGSPFAETIGVAEVSADEGQAPGAAVPDDVAAGPAEGTTSDQQAGMQAGRSHGLDAAAAGAAAFLATYPAAAAEDQDASRGDPADAGAEPDASAIVPSGEGPEAAAVMERSSDEPPAARLDEGAAGGADAAVESASGPGKYEAAQGGITVDAAAAGLPAPESEGQAEAGDTAAFAAVPVAPAPAPDGAVGDPASDSQAGPRGEPGNATEEPASAEGASLPDQEPAPASAGAAEAQLADADEGARAEGSSPLPGPGMPDAPGHEIGSAAGSGASAPPSPPASVPRDDAAEPSPDTADMSPPAEANEEGAASGFESGLPLEGEPSQAEGSSEPVLWEPAPTGHAAEGPVPGDIVHGEASARFDDAARFARTERDHEGEAEPVEAADAALPGSGEDQTEPPFAEDQSRGVAALQPEDAGPEDADNGDRVEETAWKETGALVPALNAQGEASPEFDGRKLPSSAEPAAVEETAPAGEEGERTSSAGDRSEALGADAAPAFPEDGAADFRPTRAADVPVELAVAEQEPSSRHFSPPQDGEAPGAEQADAVAAAAVGLVPVPSGGGAADETGTLARDGSENAGVQTEWIEPAAEEARDAAEPSAAENASDGKPVGPDAPALAPEAAGGLSTDEEGGEPESGGVAVAAVETGDMEPATGEKQEAADAPAAENPGDGRPADADALASDTAGDMVSKEENGTETAERPGSMEEANAATARLDKVAGSGEVDREPPTGEGQEATDAPAAEQAGDALPAGADVPAPDAARDRFSDDQNNTETAERFQSSEEADAGAAQSDRSPEPGAVDGEGASEDAPYSLAAEQVTPDEDGADRQFGLSGGGSPPAAAEDGGEEALRRPQPDTSILDRLPVPVLIHSGDVLHYANPEFLLLADYSSLGAFGEAGGLGCLFTAPWERIGEGGDRHLQLRTGGGAEFPVEALLRAVPWREAKALLLVLRRLETMPARDTAEAAALGQRLSEMRAIIDTATDGVVLFTPDGTIRSLSRPAEALFGLDSADAAGLPFGALFAAESQRIVADYLRGLAGDGVASVMNDGREVIGREAKGGFIPLFMTVGGLPEGSGFCAVLRDITQWKRAEEELVQSRALAERASSHKTDFLARVSHEIRTPLNAIIGFSELMLGEKFGPVGSDRYRDYLRDINRSGSHVLDLVNDLLDISKIEAGQQEMSYEAVALNDALGEAVATMQPQANRERVIIRSSFAARLPDVVADPRSVRQIALNVLSNAIRFTQAGGQVIVSTAHSSSGDVVMRVRDTGIGMSQAEVEQALKPFKQINSLKRSRGDGTGLGLPLTKAMVEANRARFAISSDPGVGTMVEVTFPATRVLAG